MAKTEKCPRCGAVMNVRGWCPNCGYEKKKVARHVFGNEV
jgi:tRNA(Ile2) C34 agmatinyltransferase TiaS